MNGRVIQGHDGIQKRKGAIAARSGNPDVTVLDVRTDLVDPVCRHDTPAFRDTCTPVKIRSGIVRKIGGTTVSTQTKHPGDAPHTAWLDAVNIVCRQDAGLSLDHAVVDHKGSALPAKNRAPGCTICGEMGVVDGQLAGAGSHNARALTNKIVAAVAAEMNFRVVDSIFALSRNNNTVKVIFAAGDGNVLCTAILHCAANHCCQNRFFWNNLPILNIQGATENSVTDCMDGNVIRNGQDNISLIGTGNDGHILAVQGHGKLLTLRRGEPCLLPDDKTK